MLRTGLISAFASVSAVKFLYMIPHPTRPTLFPYTTLFRSGDEPGRRSALAWRAHPCRARGIPQRDRPIRVHHAHGLVRSEEHTSELQSHVKLVCRLLLEKKKSFSDPTLLPNTATLIPFTLL